MVAPNDTEDKPEDGEIYTEMNAFSYGIDSLIEGRFVDVEGYV